MTSIITLQAVNTTIFFTGLCLYTNNTQEISHIGVNINPGINKQLFSQRQPWPTWVVGRGHVGGLWLGNERRLKCRRSGFIFIILLIGVILVLFLFLAFCWNTHTQFNNIYHGFNKAVGVCECSCKHCVYVAHHWSVKYISNTVYLHVVTCRAKGHVPRQLWVRNEGEKPKWKLFWLTSIPIKILHI